MATTGWTERRGARLGMRPRSARAAPTAPCRNDKTRPTGGRSGFANVELRVTAQDVTEIVARYRAGDTTQQMGNRYGISMSPSCSANTTWTAAVEA